MTNITLPQARELAIAYLTKVMGNRSQYAQDVIMGGQAWSGADLQGNAARYGKGYKLQRRNAQYAWLSCHPDTYIVACGNGGKLRSAIAIGMDDYGNMLFRTSRGVYVPRARKSQRLVKVGG